MKKIAIISGSIRKNRQSHKIALFFDRYITEMQLAQSEIIDLKELNFPIVEERLALTENPTQNQLLFSAKIFEADAVIIVSPEYNGSYPAALKNAIDMLGKEWLHKPVGIVTVSSGVFGGVNVNALLQILFTRLKALVVTASFPVPNVQQAFDEQGIPMDKESIYKRAESFLSEVLWFTEKFNS